MNGDFLYLAEGSCGLRVVKIVRPEVPAEQGKFDAAAPALKLSLTASTLSVMNHGLKWDLDISNPIAPILRSTGEAPPIGPTVAAVEFAGNYLYVGSHRRGIEVLDMSDPSKPSRVGGLPLNTWVFDLAISGNILVVANNSDGMQVVDITDPASPKLIGNWRSENNAFGVAIAGNRAYLAARNVYLLDLDIPSAPRLLGEYRELQLAAGVEVSGDTVYSWGDSTLQTHILDVSNPANPARLGTFGRTAWTIKVRKDKAYVADPGFTIYDVLDPATPKAVGSFAADNPDYYVRGLATMGHHVFLGRTQQGVTMVDVSNPAEPTLLDTYDTPGSASDVAVYQDLVAVADDYGGVSILRNTLAGLSLRLKMGTDSRTFTITGTVSGKEYILEKRLSLSPPDAWRQIATVTAQSEEASVQEQTAQGETAFYRIREN